MNYSSRSVLPRISTFPVDAFTVIIRFLWLEYQFGAEAARTTAVKAPVLEYRIFPILFSHLPSIGHAYCTDGSIELEFNQPFRQILLDKQWKVKHPEGADYEEGLDELADMGMKLCYLLGDLEFESTQSSLSIFLDSRL